MPLLDDQTLGTLLHELGDSFAVPPLGAADTLRLVRQGDAERTEPKPEQAPFETPVVAASPGPIRGTIRAHRILSLAAALLVLVAVAGGALFLTNTALPSSKAQLASPPVHHTPLSGASSPSGATKRFGVQPPASTGTTKGATANSAGSAFSAASPKASSTGEDDLPSGSVGNAPLIEETGALNLTVAQGRLASTMTTLTTLATTYGGFVANSETQSSTADGLPSGTVTLQIPVANFSPALKEAESLGKVAGLTTNATDVTAHYVDLQSRITALEDSRQQYLTIMAKASSIGDVLAVQAQLDSLQSQIEQLQGQLNLLASETSDARLTAQVSEAVPAHHRSTPAALSGLAKAWHDSVRGFADGAEGLLSAGGPALFALLCLAALYLGGRVSWRRLQRRSL